VFGNLVLASVAIALLKARYNPCLTFKVSDIAIKVLVLPD
jgi:hypothetical protein